MDIFIKASLKVSIFNKTSIKIKDIAEVFAPKEILNKINALPVIHIDSDMPVHKLISIIDIIKLIDTNFPGNTISSVGEIETLVYFEKEQQIKCKWLEYLKVALICVILIAGSATAIMSFHTDAQIPTVFRNFYYIFFNETSESMSLIDIPYSLGLAVGIIVFFNHFTKKSATEDPTPIDVEMTVYEKDVIETMVDRMSLEQTVVGKKQV